MSTSQGAEGGGGGSSAENESQDQASANPSGGNVNYVDIPPPKLDYGAPPSYEESVSTANNPPPQFDDSEILPPTYEEVQLQKEMEAERESSYPMPYSVSAVGGVDTEAVDMTREQLLGTDFIFCVAFAAAFIFNWIGFILLLCFCHTVAGRTGALAGFGLSLAKWAVIVQHSTDLVADSNTWLLWLIIVLGVLICVRASRQYLQAKRDFQLVHPSTHQSFFLFY